MATIRKEFTVAVPPDRVWAALRDFGRVHEVLAPGFVTGCTLEDGGAVRAITFANGMSVRERLVACDDSLRRLAYAAEGGSANFHHASAEAVPAGNGTRFVWTTDVLPDSLAPAIEAMMDAGVKAMQRALADA